MFPLVQVVTTQDNMQHSIEFSVVVTHMHENTKSLSATLGIVAGIAVRSWGRGGGSAIFS